MRLRLGSTQVKSSCYAALLALVPALALPEPAAAHDSWISREQFHDPTTNAWCCDEHDCAVVDELDVRLTDQGFVVFGKYTVRQNRVLPSRDGKYWACINEEAKGPHDRPAGVRCFFAPFNV